MEGSWAYHDTVIIRLMNAGPHMSRDSHPTIWGPWTDLEITVDDAQVMQVSHATGDIHGGLDDPREGERALLQQKMRRS